LKQHPGMPCQPTLPYHAAQLVTLDRAADAAALEDYTCSHSMRGVAVELAVAVRPAALVRTVTALLPSDAALPAALLRARPALAASGPDHSLHVMLLPCLCRQQPAGECERPAFPDLAALLARMQRQALCAAQDSQPESATRSCARKRTTCGRPSAWTRHSWSSAGACRLATAAGPARRCGARAVPRSTARVWSALCQLLVQPCVAVMAGGADAAVQAPTRSGAPCMRTLTCAHI